MNVSFVDRIFKSRRQVLATAIAFGALWCNAHAADSAETFPTRSIKLVVGFSAGGPTDVAARIVAAHMSKTLGQPVVVDNRPGSNGISAAQAVMSSAPDGYTLLMGTNGMLTMYPAIKADAKFKPLTDLAPIALVSSFPYLLVVNPKVLPVTSVKELVDFSKRNPAQVTYGSGGIGNVSHLGAELFATSAGVKLVHVPYKGDSAFMNDLIAGHVSMAFASIPVGMPQVQEGNVKALAITKTHRSDKLPDLPTMMESGFSEFHLEPWNGILGPAALPADIVAKINRSIGLALQDPETLKRLADLSLEPLFASPEEFRKRLEVDLVRWKKVADDSKISIE